MNNVFAAPLASAPVEARVEYLKKVALYTLLGLFIAGVSSAFSALFIAPYVLGSTVAYGVVFFGSFGIAYYVAPKWVFGSNKWLGFLAGTIAEGIAMGVLLLIAIMVGIDSGAGAFALIGEALGLTALACFGILAYIWSNPRELSAVKALLSALFVPMLLLMGLTFMFPIGGLMGTLIAGAFVIISVLGLLYQTNKVLHELHSDMHLEGAYLITLGVLVLFWNLLSLLTRR